ncbi:chaperone [Burkholderia lata]|uniref:DMT family transporter n=1 Tax=Burkholderia lata (strain ATCC 17760 / DSM 23089 / LMG 22485 / NCIMB 9086 / R18194 / 383) TaxID=482957 RepID=UPI001452FFD1|nr:multidrug efflux SMR transporter [Burkholderia lata]VWD64603.1 chaperone [Burkholderia lata]
MEWLLLGLAVVSEIVWALSLKWTTVSGASKLAAVVPIALSFLNMFLLAQAMRTIPAGTAYAIWTGLGAAGVALGSYVVFKQNISMAQMASILLIVVGVAGTKLFSHG